MSSAQKTLTEAQIVQDKARRRFKIIYEPPKNYVEEWDTVQWTSKYFRLDDLEEIYRIITGSPDIFVPFAKKKSEDVTEEGGEEYRNFLLEENANINKRVSYVVVDIKKRKEAEREF